MTNSRPLALAIAALTLGACARTENAAGPSPAIRSVPARTGFLADYSKLRPSPRHASTLYELRAGLASCDALIIEPIEVVAGATARGERIDAITANELRASLRAEILEALETGPYRVVDAPGPGVGRLRAAITAAARSGRDPRTGKQMLGGAAMEVEIVDSLSGDRLMAAVEADSPSAMESSPDGSAWSDARLVFAHWAARLKLALRDAKSGALPTTD